MTTDEIARELQRYLKLYAIGKKEEYIVSIVAYAGMLAGRVTK